MCNVTHSVPTYSKEFYTYFYTNFQDPWTLPFVNILNKYVILSNVGMIRRQYHQYQRQNINVLPEYWNLGREGGVVEIQHKNQNPCGFLLTGFSLVKDCLRRHGQTPSLPPPHYNIVALPRVAVEANKAGIGIWVYFNLLVKADCFEMIESRRKNVLLISMCLADAWNIFISLCFMVNIYIYRYIDIYIYIYIYTVPVKSFDTPHSIQWQGNYDIIKNIIMI